MTRFLQFTLLGAVLGLSACDQPLFKKAEVADEPPGISPPIELVEEEEEVVIGAGGQTVDTLDQVSESDLAEAENVSGGNGLGTTVASLGDVTQQGLWLKTPLVKTETAGRLESEDGKSLAVTLIPIEGEATAGSRISLSAMRGLGLGLTDLPTLNVFRVSGNG